MLVVWAAPDASQYADAIEVGGGSKDDLGAGAWPPAARTLNAADSTFQIGTLSLNSEQKASAAVAAPSALHERRRSTERVAAPAAAGAAASSGSSSSSHHLDLSQPYVSAGAKPAIGWEPVSPGIIDRSPEVVAKRRPNEYYWPSEKEVAKAQASSSSSASSSSAAASAGAGADSSDSAAARDAMLNRRGSKASELAFPIAGLEGGMLSMTNAEYRGLIKSALRSSDLATARRLLTAPLPESVGTIQMCMKRHRHGLKEKFFPGYELLLEEPQQPFFVMSAKKRAGNKTSNYTISLLSLDMLSKSNNEASMTSEDPNYLGKLRSNFSGSEFVGYDAGINPKTLIAATFAAGSGAGSRRASETKMSNVRQELCTVLYENNIMSRCPRKFKAIVPGMLREDPTKRIICRPLVPSDTLLYQYKALIDSEASEQPKLHEDALVHQEILVLHNKAPVFEPSIQAFCLNFHGRATAASVKNFQLVNCREDQMKQKQDSKVHLQFGKMDKDIFTMVSKPTTPPARAWELTGRSAWLLTRLFLSLSLRVSLCLQDVAYPLSIVQAFEISLAGLDAKLVCD